MAETEAIRAVGRGDVQGVGFPEAIARRARELMVMGWVRGGDDGNVLLHAEGDRSAVAALVAFLEDGVPLARVTGVKIEQGTSSSRSAASAPGCSSSRSTGPGRTISIYASRSPG